MASDPFTGVSLANTHISDKASDQSQRQPSYDVWGITPTTAPPIGAPVSSSVPQYVTQPMSGYPPAAQQAHPQQAHPQQAYPQQAYTQQPPAPPQYQAYPQAPSLVQPMAPNSPVKSMQSMTSVPAQTPPQTPHQASINSLNPTKNPITPPLSYQGVNHDAFGNSNISPTSVANPFAVPQATLTQSASTPQCSTIEIKDVRGDESPKDAVSVADDEADFWAQMGFAVEETPAPAPAAGATDSSFQPLKPGMVKRQKSLRASIVRSFRKTVENNNKEAPVDSDAVDDKGMPVGGEYYEVKLPGGTFGTVLHSPTQVSKNIYCRVPEAFIKKLESRPVVAYSSSESAADRSGISIGDVVLKVQDNDVQNPKSAMAELRKECNERCSFKGIKLVMWKPPSSINVTLSENQCMTEYHIRSHGVPTTSFEWKSKYVVIGGIGSTPDMINMYYGKRDYDKAMSEHIAKKPRVSVKVKSWSLLGGHLLTPKPKMVHYAAQKTPWYYIIVATHKGKAIKIAHPLLDGIKPIFEGVKRALKQD